MPKDKSGKFHLNSQRAHAADRASEGGKAPMHSTEAPPMQGAEEHEPGSVHEHLAAMHAESGGKHMHVHHDGMSFTTHHVGDDGEVQGPHDHQNLEELKAHMDQFFDEEGQEGHSGMHDMATGHPKDVY